VQGVTLIALISFAAGVSGGHLNPAVTAALMLTGAIDVFMAVCYVLSQMVRH
jgi:aquaporin-4